MPGSSSATNIFPLIGTSQQKASIAIQFKNNVRDPLQNLLLCNVLTQRFFSSRKHANYPLHKPRKNENCGKEIDSFEKAVLRIREKDNNKQYKSPRPPNLPPFLPRNIFLINNSYSIKQPQHKQRRTPLPAAEACDEDDRNNNDIPNDRKQKQQNHRNPKPLLLKHPRNISNITHK